MRKGYEIKTKNRRIFRFNKQDQFDFFFKACQGTPWEAKQVRVYQMRKLSEIKAREYNPLEDMMP